jgi:acyl dehydratase
MQNKLPEIAAMRWPALWSLRRGVRVAESGIKLERSYREVELQQAQLRDFVAHFGFRTDAPLCYLYTLAQRAQLHLMLSPEFTIASPGMVHLENYLTKHADYLPTTPFGIEASIAVEYKESGSLVPVSEIRFYQEGKLVATNRSVYLARRRSKSKSGKKKATARPQAFGPVHYQTNWELAAGLGKVYAELSGDRNPIHTSRLFAWLAGFPRPILHGWYSVSKIEQTIEAQFAYAASELGVKFMAPVLLPGEVQLQLQKGEDATIAYQLRTPHSDKLLLSGQLSSGG